MAPTLLALLAASVVTYLGAGAQSMTFEFLVGINFALALSLVAGFLALREQRTRGGAFGSRYVQWIAMFILLGLMPAIVATLRPVRMPWSRMLGVAAAVGLVAVFVLNLDHLRTTRRFNEDWAAVTEAEVRSAVTVVSRLWRRPAPGSGRAAEHGEPPDHGRAAPGPPP